MKFEEIIEMYIDWVYGCDETVHQSDILSACFEYGFDYDEVVKAGDAEGAERFGY